MHIALKLSSSDIRMKNQTYFGIFKTFIRSWATKKKGNVKWKKFCTGVRCKLEGVNSTWWGGEFYMVGGLVSLSVLNLKNPSRPLCIIHVWSISRSIYGSISRKSVDFSIDFSFVFCGYLNTGYRFIAWREGLRRWPYATSWSQKLQLHHPRIQEAHHKYPSVWNVPQLYE